METLVHIYKKGCHASFLFLTCV